MIPNILSIAGSDPSGGAGIQADLKSISANGGFAMAAVTALTAQNTQGVTGVHLVPPKFVAEQIETVFLDIQVHAVKIGMIANAEIAASVADALVDYNVPIVLDPVMYAKGGAPLLQPDAMDTLRDRLLPLATVLTPNLPEAAQLLGQPEADSRAAMVSQGQALLSLGPKAVLMKGGHLEADSSPDCLVTHDDTVWFESARVNTKNTHGTGCTLSSALATWVGHGASPATAVKKAKDFVGGAISTADALKVGSGHGPTNHFHALYATLPI